MVNPLDKLLSINQRDRDASAAEFEARRDKTRLRLKKEIERFVALARDEVENHSVNPGLEIYELDSVRYLGMEPPHRPRHHFLILFTDEGYRLIEDGAQCYMEEVKEGDDTIKILRNPTIDDRIPFYQDGDTVGSPSYGYAVDDGAGNQHYVAAPYTLSAENQWHDSDVFTADVEPMAERQLNMMAEDLLILSDKIKGRQTLRAAGF